ncbi:hypothetical protein MGYG_06779 [Nannizzia gypsea CBS 118893]|uniref:Uncharacterized protein n=1 Tax=Arthroderma gypseum (strain ATCC MYA-4604 / CBS 118893) TaxID=535722 RepID=E4V165_ARTGP|nr:hypothetical protein MGYG_06779 [Nannizzia gypsea CBS 118893]EFR03780.1 hypothetical protein MGYG_06779 [Nannizzia gypsea CBS 118893]
MHICIRVGMILPQAAGLRVPFGNREQPVAKLAANKGKWKPRVRYRSPDVYAGRTVRGLQIRQLALTARKEWLNQSISGGERWKQEERRFSRDAEVFLSRG